MPVDQNFPGDPRQTLGALNTCQPNLTYFRRPQTNLKRHNQLDPLCKRQIQFGRL